MQAIRAAIPLAFALGVAGACVASATDEAVRAWIIPETPGGLQSNQNWHAIGSTPGGDIIVAGMDHVTNSALFRIAARSDKLEFIGDARSASEAASNWHPGETAQKFHTRPTSLGNRMTYVATLDYSAIDNGHLKRRGFHWYGFATGGSGSTIDELELVVFLTVFGSQIQHGGTVTRALRISAGESARTFSYDDLGVPGDAKGVMFEVIKDRRDYVTGDRHLAFFGDISIEGR